MYRLVNKIKAELYYQLYSIYAGDTDGNETIYIDIKQDFYVGINLLQAYHDYVSEGVEEMKLSFDIALNWATVSAKHRERFDGTYRDGEVYKVVLNTIIEVLEDAHTVVSDELRIREATDGCLSSMYDMVREQYLREEFRRRYVCHSR